MIVFCRERSVFLIYCGEQDYEDTYTWKWKNGVFLFRPVELQS